MDGAYQAEAWKDFYVMFGGAVAALTGLLFVATSLHVDEIGKTPHFRVRAFGNTFEFVGRLIASALVLVPQRPSWLGIELTALNTLWFLLIQVRFQVTWSRARAHVWLLRRSLGIVGAVLGILGGASIVVRFGGGLYLCALGGLILVCVVVWNAFDLMMAKYTDAP